MDPSHEVWLLLRSFAALIVVILLAYVSLRFGLPYLMQRRSAGRVRRLSVEEFCPLDRNHRLYVVRWEDQQILLATSPDRVQLIQARSGPSPEDFEETLNKLSRPDAEPGGSHATSR